jgi:hypothetical protein
LIFGDYVAETEGVDQIIDGDAVDGLGDAVAKEVVGEFERRAIRLGDRD